MRHKNERKQEIKSENIQKYVEKISKNMFLDQTVDKVLLLQGFAIVGTAFLI